MGDGTRRRSGCLGCRKRKRRCDEQKPVCRRCAKAMVCCTYPDSRHPFKIKTIISRAGQENPLPVSTGEHVEFINLVSDDLPKLCDKYLNQATRRHTLSGMLWTPLAPRCPFGIPISSTHLSYEESELRLVQYYFDVISTSRVYVSTERNLFRSSIMPFLFHNRGPLLFAVIALSAMEKSRLQPLAPVDYSSIAEEYKSRSLVELQNRLEDPQAAEENLLACVIQSSLEISGGSQPAWLLHLRGALAILKQFQGSINPEAACFAVQYYHFRHTLMRTTELAEPDTPADLNKAEIDSLVAALSQVAADNGLRTLYTDNTIDEHLGCSPEMVQLISYMSQLRRKMAQEQSLHLPQPSILLEAQTIDERLQNMSFISPLVDGDYLLRSAACFRTAAELYLQLTCLETAINDPIVLKLENMLLDKLSLVILEDQPRRSFPMWPLFIAGCASFEDGHRKLVLKMFNTLNKKWPISNIATVSHVVWAIWQNRDLCMRLPTEQQRDWQEVIDKFRWKLALT